jgi:sugar-specific transcriptional regulator TrmB
MNVDYQNLKKAFEQLGLSENEVTIYFELLKLGQSAIVELSKNTGIARSSCYDIIDRLQRVGLVSKVNQKNREEYSAEDPKIIVKLLSQVQEKASRALGSFKESLPHLLALSNKVEKETDVRYFSGTEAVKNLLFQILEEVKDSELLNICQGYSDKEAELARDPEYLLDYIKKESELKIKARTIMEDMKSAREYKNEYGNEFNQILLVPSLANNKTVHIDKYIWCNKVCFFNHQNDSAVLIEDPFIAENERISFDILWEQLSH